MRRLILLSLFTLALAAAACAGETPVASTFPMPAGFENVHLGMTFNDLQAARPGLRRDQFAPHYDLAHERLSGDGYFTAATYEFTNKRLAKVVLTRTGTSEEIAGRCAGLIEGTTRKWGEPTDRAVGIIRRHPVTGADYEYPLLTWKRGDATVVVNCITTLDLKNAPNFYTVAIFDPSIPLEKAWKADVLPDSSPAEFDRRFRDLLAPGETRGPLFQ